MRRIQFFRSESDSTVNFFGSTNQSINGGAIIVSSMIQQYVKSFRPIKNIILHIKLDTTSCTLNMVQAYTPTSTAEEQNIQNFYEELKKPYRAFLEER